MTLAAGQVFCGRYRVEAALGQGGMATTYRVHDLLDGEDVALKLLSSRALEAELLGEFERLRGLVHPNLARVYSLGRASLRGELCPFYTSALVDGGTLSDLRAREGFEATLPFILDALDALSFLHSLGLRHGDLKPDNILCTTQGKGVLIDLGCAAPLHRKQALVSGTPGFIAPEVLAGEAADERADLYALGSMLRELGAPERFKPLIERLTEPSAVDRPPSVGDVMVALGRPLRQVFPRHAPVVHMVGRAAERARAHAFFDAFHAAEPGPRVLTVWGASGVGRSRFLRELLWDEEPRLAVHEARAHQRSSLRACLERASGSKPAPGTEGLLSAVDGLVRGRARTLLALDDAEQLDAQDRQELVALLRAMPEQGNLSILLCSDRPPPDEVRGVSIELKPLERAALKEWAGASFEERYLDALVDYTGGYPRYVAEALEALSAGALRPSELGEKRSSAAVDHARGLEAKLAGLDASALDGLLQIALWTQVPHGPALMAARFEERALSELSNLDLIRIQGPHVSLARGAERETLLRGAPATALVRVRPRLLEELAVAPDPWSLGTRLLLLLQLDRVNEAEALLMEQAGPAREEPRHILPFLRAALGRASLELCLLASELLRACAEPQLALKYLGRARRQKLSARGLHRLEREAAESYLSLGRFRRALRFASRSHVVDPASVELRARALLKLGEFEAAAGLVRQIMPQAREDALPLLLETLATAEAYLGNHVQALEHIEQAVRLFEGKSPRALARCLAFRCFVAYRSGDTQHAAQSAERVRDLAEQHGYDDLLVNALTNLGSAREMLGAWGSAIDCYERALGLSVALGRAGSVRSLRANLANLCLEIGLFDRARELLRLLELDAGLTAAQRHAALLYTAELSLLQGDAPRALLQLDGLLPALLKSGAAREEVMARSLRALAYGDLGEADAAHSELELSFRQLEALDSADVAAWASAMLGRAALRLSTGVEQRARIEAVLKRAVAAGLDALAAALHTVSFEIYQEAQAHALAREQRERALAMWERIAFDLSPSTRDLFWKHPFRQKLRQEEAQVERSPGRATLNLKRVFELNRRLNSALSVKGVLDFAIDAATEMTSAERGFVLLAPEDAAGFEVAVARNLDRKRLSGEELKLSRSIAESVIRDDEPVLTLDAGTDQRFATQASVHAMRLKSVLCVPIRSPRGVLGALYLDTRVQRARFERTDLELLMAFADQVAVALTNARLVSELEQRTRELSREKQRVEELSHGQAKEIARLEEELDKRNEALELRYDYSQIVGRSEAMRRVFAVLDRVIDSDLGVLVQGESGTGKELVARAIHFNSPRKSKPFLGLNCAALPENLIESELFGVTKGAFTGADRDRPGLVLSAQGGTLFLDELQELPLGTQAKLLRVLQERKVRAVGGTRATDFDVRILCASNRDLMQRVRDGLFREDLYYRVAVVELSLPALRERAEDILPIAEALLKRSASDTGKAPRRLLPDAVRALLAYGFPGNVRELENILLRASVMAEGSGIGADDLGLTAARGKVRELSRTRKDFEAHEAQRLLSQLEAERWNVSRVAKNLGIPRNTLYRKLARYGLARDPES